MIHCYSVFGRIQIICGYKPNIDIPTSALFECLFGGVNFECWEMELQISDDELTLGVHLRRCFADVFGVHVFLKHRVSGLEMATSFEVAHGMKQKSRVFVVFFFCLANFLKLIHVDMGEISCF